MDSSAFFLSTVAAGIGLFTLFRNLRLHREDNEENDNSTSFSAFLLSTVAAAIGMFTLFRNLRLHREDIEENDNSASSSSSPQPALSLSSPSASLNRNRTHHVFPSFRGEDVRRDFLSHIQTEFQRKGITPFIDNEIKRGDSIGPELIRAIKESKVAIILLSRNYASSSWCLNELAEIMKCREELGQKVMVVFYKVDPSDVKKLNGRFGKVFSKTCGGKSKEDIRRWRQALAEVATIAGYDSNNWDNEAAMINKIATDISSTLNNSSPSRDFDGFVGMRRHLKNMKELLCLDSDEVRMVGIWGPSGIGKTTIASGVYNEFCNSFQMSVFMDPIEAMYTRPRSNYRAKLLLQQQFMSKITNEKDMEISHLGVVKDRLKDKKVLVVLDGVEQSMQLDAMAEKPGWFGPGSRIIITTQSRNLFREHPINQIYEVDFPPNDEALQMLCMYAFRQKSPIDGFEKLALEVTSLAGNLPLGLEVMGLYLRGMSRQEWEKAITRLRNSLDTKIQSILKLSYDALDDQDKDLFLHIACFFNHEEVEKVEAYLADSFGDGIGHGLNVLTEKSLISIKYGYITMHKLLAHLGNDIVHKQHIRQRLYLTDRREFSELLKDDAGNKSVIGIYVYFQSIEEICQKNERAFEGMCNLQFLKFRDFSGESNSRLHLPRGLDHIFQNLRLLEWRHCPMTCLPSIFKTDFLIVLKMSYSKLEKLWEGTKPLQNLKSLNLYHSEKLRVLPDLSTATNLQELSLGYCSGLINLPSSIGNATNLQRLNLGHCSSLINLPSSIGNATNLQRLNLGHCSSLINLPSSIGNATNLQVLNLSNCSSLINLPSSIGNATNLQNLDLRHCSSLINLPSSIGNATNLQRLNLGDCSSLINLPSSIGNATNLQKLDLTYCSSLVELSFPIGNLHKLKRLELEGCDKLEVLPININFEPLHTLDLTDSLLLERFPEISTNISVLNLQGTAIKEVPASIKSCFGLNHLELRGCRKLVSLPQLPDSIVTVDATNCESLERLDCSFQNSDIRLEFGNCFKLNQEAKDLIIQASSSYAILPGTEVPAYFTHRAKGGSLRIKLNEMLLPTSMTFKACVLLVYGGNEAGVCFDGEVTWNGKRQCLYPLLSEHLYIFNVAADVISSEVVFDFKLENLSFVEEETISWKIEECGVVQLSEVSL